jgi:hypothetical protein
MHIQYRRRGSQKKHKQFPNLLLSFGEVGRGYFFILKSFNIMKNLILISITVLIISLLASCDKNNPEPVKTKGEVTGRVLALNSKDPVPNAKVTLYKSVWSGGLVGGSANTVEVATTTTNSNGEYSFSFDYKTGDDYFMLASADKYVVNNNTLWTIEGKKQVRDIILEPYAWIKLRIINVPPSDDKDYFNIGGYLYDIQSANHTYSAYGKKCDTTFVKKVLGNQKTAFSIDNWSANQPKLEYVDSVYCKGLDTIFHTITY